MSELDQAGSAESGPKQRRISLGIPGRPYPMRDSAFVEDGKGERVLSRHIGVLEETDPDRALDIWTNKTYAEVIGMAYREMPTPEMLSLFMDALILRRPASKMRIQYFKGDPGAGKTYMAELIGRMRDVRGPIVVNCGDKNIGELFYETVLDFGSSKTFCDELDKRLSSGMINPLSLNLMKQGLGGAFVEENGRGKILWDKIGDDTAHKNDLREGAKSRALAAFSEVGALEGLDSSLPAADFYKQIDERMSAGTISSRSLDILKEVMPQCFSEKEGKTIADWTKIEKPPQLQGDIRRVLLEKAQDTFKKVSFNEGLDNLGGNALGMTTQEGPLIQAWREGREIVLDEYNKSKEGTDGMMQLPLQLFADDGVRQATVENSIKEKGDGAKQRFIFRQDEMKSGFFVTLTGNSEEDGTTTRELSQSVHSRVPPELIPKATVQGWTHRICQMMTGLPISTIYYSSREQWDRDPQAFARFLTNMRTLGLSDDEKAKVSDLQLRRLQKWENTMKAAERLAKLCFKWSQMVNPESELMRSGALAKIIVEIDERYKSEVSMDFRRIGKFLKKALEPRPEVKFSVDTFGYDEEKWDKEPRTPDTVIREDPTIRFGTRLCKVVIDHIIKTTFDIGKMALGKQLLTEAEDCGFIETKLHEGKKGAELPVWRLLDENPFDAHNPELQAEMIRDMICGFLRDQDPKLPADNSKIMMPGILRNLIDDIEKQDGTPEEPVEAESNFPIDSNSFVMINKDINSIRMMPLMPTSTLDLTRLGADAVEVLPTIDDLLSEGEMMATLGMPQIGDRNLRALFNQAISGSGIVSENDQSIKIAEDQDEKGLAMTTVMVRRDGKNGPEATPIHVLWNHANDKLLIVGNDLKPSLSSIFNHRGITFVSRDDRKALEKIKEAMPKIIGKGREQEEKHVRLAFLMRNKMTDAAAESSKSLAELLVDKTVSNYLPHYILNKPIAPALMVA